MENITQRKIAEDLFILKYFLFVFKLLNSP